MFSIIDYDTGNTRNLKKALNYLQIENKLTDDKETILKSDAIILPGVGAFGAAMSELEKRNLVDVIKLAATQNTPILGICLGMQLLFDTSEEYGIHKGLGLIPGNVVAIPSEVKVPQMGWNQNKIVQSSEFDSIDGQYTYFVHSYYAKCNEQNILAEVEYGTDIPSIVKNNNVYGMQFHPEKSGKVGLRLLKEFQKAVES